MAGLDDIAEQKEWTDAISSVIAFEGTGRADDLLDEVVAVARRSGGRVPFAANTAYINTIPLEAQPEYPANREIERRIRAAIRWNAAAIVVKANKESSELGGHIASFQSAATLYDTGFMHFWHAPSETHGGDLIFVQGHSSPGIYARAFVEGRLTEEQLMNFRQETGGKGLSSYPHPWLMPDFWQFPTVSMGLGPLMAIYQARFLKYLHGRGLADTSNRHVWMFCGDGEMDEPESLGAIGLAGREKLDNLIFVVNCNLQRLDGPVRGNGKIVQELEANFRGTGWNVIKVLWGSGWDELIASDTTGRLRQLMEECLDGEYQDFKSKDGAYIRKHFFGRYPETAAMVAGWTDDRIWALTRGGHDPTKVYAAYKAAVEQQGQANRHSRQDRQGLRHGVGRRRADDHPSGEEDGARGAEAVPRPVPNPGLGRGSAEAAVPQAGGRLGGTQISPGTARGARRLSAGEAHKVRCRRLRCRRSLPSKPCSRRAARVAISQPPWRFVRILNVLLRDKSLGKRIVPIVPDESRTFGMEGMFRQYGIFSQVGQLYRPQDADQLMYYKEDKSGQMLQEGINEARRHVELDRGGHKLFDLQLPDDPLLHLLLDVRLPAHRRPRLGGGRLAGPRLPHRRHLGAHDAERRGPAARGRAQSHPVGHHSELHLLRSDLRL